MNWYKEATSKYDILSRKILDFFVDKIKQSIIQRDRAVERKGPDAARRKYRKHYNVYEYKQPHGVFGQSDVGLVLNLLVNVEPDSFLRIDGEFLGLWGSDFKIQLNLDIPYSEFNLQNMQAIREKLLIGIRHELEHLKEYKERTQDFDTYWGDDILSHLMKEEEIRATAMSLKMLAERTRDKNEAPDYDGVAEKYSHNFFMAFDDEFGVDLATAEKLRQQYKQKILDFIGKERLH